VTAFTETTPTLENFWRSIILFGRNVASYKFALGKSLLELGTQSHNAESARRPNHAGNGREGAPAARFRTWLPWTAHPGTAGSRLTGKFRASGK
jgi:hypothetical protein